MRISGVIIAFNSENLLADCIDSIQFCNEIIVVDARSTDRTVELSKQLGAKVVKGDESDFAKQRTIGMKAAKGDWIFYIDTDERATPELGQNIVKVIHEKNNMAAYTVKRQNFYLGNNPWPKIEKLERLFKKEKLQGWFGKLHESPRVTGEIGELDGLLLHYTHRNLSTMLAKTIQWSEVEAKLRYDAHHPKMTWWRFPRVMLTAFWDSYVRQEGWKVGAVGIIESVYQSFSMFITYARLWELQQGGK